ncbi:MAG: GcvT family protein [Rhodospirillales bacterium]
MANHARVVVIGGGVVGCSVLYHLTKLGWKDVALLEKSELTSGSTWHAAGGIHTLNSDANVSRLQKYTIDLYRELEQITGQSCGIHLTGGLMLASLEEHLDFIKLVRSRGRYLGFETEMISLEQARKYNPLIEPQHFVGALWRGDGGHVDPSGVTQAYAKAARMAGAQVHRFAPVKSLKQNADGSWTVATDKGDWRAEHVVNAAGLWARDVGRMVGIELPVLAMEHHYIVTDEIPEVANHGSEILATQDYTGEIYMRQEGKGVLLGTYEQACVPWSPEKTPDDFSMELLPHDLDRIAPSLELGFAHFPAVGRAGMKRIVNGPFTFAPDGNPLVGPVRGLRNFWSACGVMAGFAQGGGVGLALSRWMVEGDPGSDVFAMDVARFGPYATPRYTSLKVQLNYKRRFRLTFPNEELTAARPLRRAPSYDRLKAAGAVFGASFGLEAPLWYAPKGVEPVENPTYRRSNAYPIVRAECLGVRNDVGIMDISGFAKYEVAGSGAEAWLNKVLANRMPKIGRLVLAPMLNERARIIGDFTVMRLGPERFLMIGSGVAEVFHLRWFDRHLPAPGVALRSLCSTLNGFMIAGPKSRELLKRVVREDVSNDAFRFFAVREMAVGMCPAVVDRASYTGDLGYEIWVTPDYHIALYETLVEAGRDLGLTHFGNRALMSLRLEKGYGAFFREFRPDYTPLEAGLDRFVAHDKPEFVGKAAAAQEWGKPPERKLVTMMVDANDADVVGYEAILRDGKAVGQVTSGGYAHWAQKSVALGYVKPEYARDGQQLKIDILGEERAAVVQTTPLFDANGGRQRG